MNRTFQVAAAGLPETANDLVGIKQRDRTEGEAMRPQGWSQEETEEFPYMRSKWLEAEDGARKEKGSLNAIADENAQMWRKLGLFDWYVTFSFDQRTHRAKRLHSPENLHRFVGEELRRFGYRGPYVIVAHDNSSTRYYHAHCLLSDYEPGLCAKVSDKFSRYGNVSKTDDGPIRGMGAFYYCANRGFPHPDAELVDECFKWVRRPRKRGKRGRTTSVSGPSSGTLERQEVGA